jgi:hypothetical protein
MLTVGRSFPLDTLDRPELHDVDATVVTYRGRRSLSLVEREQPARQTDPIAIVTGSHFSDGVIEFALADGNRRIRGRAASRASPSA